MRYKVIKQCICNSLVTLLKCHAHCDRACARRQLPIPHIQFRMIITATWKELVQYVFFMEDFLSNKDSSDEIIGQFPVWNIGICDIKSAVIDFTQGTKGCRIIGVSGFRHKRRTRPFSVYEECAQLFTTNVSWVTDLLPNGQLPPRWLPMHQVTPLYIRITPHQDNSPL